MNRAGLLIVMMMVSSVAPAQELPTLLDLSGNWKFDIGDDTMRAKPGYDDRNWSVVHVPSPWEDQGFPGYDGYGWYRKHFYADQDWLGRALYLSLGSVDDVDEAYLNGHMIGFTGGFPPHYMTAYDARRVYHIPPEFLNKGGDNVIAVRVYDGELSGGILGNRVAIVEDNVPLFPDVAIKAGWKFTAGDDMGYKEPGFDDTKWQNVIVPLYWEAQGHREYDGYAWYRVKFTLPDKLVDQRLILLAGKIDDFDETYLNGERIGRTGSMSHPRIGLPSGTGEYLELRAYTIPSGLLKRGGENVLAVRVFDGFMQGGIYDGPVGVVTRENYLNWQHRHDGNKNPVNRFLEWLFR